MHIPPSIRVGVVVGVGGFTAAALLACLGSAAPGGGNVTVDGGGAPSDADTSDVGAPPADTGTVDSGPATGPRCRGDLDCNVGVRRHCLLDPGREGFCVQCAPEQGFTCPAGQSCSGGLCVDDGHDVITGPPCRTDVECVTGDRRHCVPDGSGSGSQVCAQCNPALPCVPGSTCANGLCVGQGALRFTLTWDRAGDVDLHVVPPGGVEIYYAARSGQGGALDRDDTTGTGPENVFWAMSPPAGSYLVCVVPYRITGSTSFRLAIARSPGAAEPVITGTRTESTGNVACSRTSPTFVTEFRY